MLKRRHRLQDKGRFRQVRQSGASQTHSLVVLWVLPNQELFSRSGITVSRRIGKAVARNRARRRIGAAVRQLWQEVLPGWDMVWVARPGINEAEFSDLLAACTRLLRRARLLKAPTEASGPGAAAARADVIGDQVRDAGARVAGSDSLL